MPHLHNPHTCQSTRTTVVIAHRLSTIQDADKIVVVHKVIERTAPCFAAYLSYMMCMLL